MIGGGGLKDRTGALDGNFNNQELMMIFVFE